MLVSRSASDLHLKADLPPRLRVEGELIQTKLEVPKNELLLDLARSLMNEGQWKRFTEEGDVDLAFDFENFGRFRMNAYTQRGKVSLAIRLIRDKIPSFEELHIPPVVKKLALLQRGLVLIAGAASSGKSTTISAMIDHINENKAKHIIMIEDPIEYVHYDKKSLIEQREVGEDTVSFSRALHFVVREDPDVIVIGEIRSAETFNSALTAAETGHLVIATVHARNVLHVFERISGFFEHGKAPDLMNRLSYNLNSIIVQRLLRAEKIKMQVPAFEILISNPMVRKLIFEGRLEKLIQALQSARGDGMCSFNQSLLELYQQGLVDRDTALAASDNPHALEMNIKGIFLDESSGGILGDNA